MRFAALACLLVLLAGAAVPGPPSVGARAPAFSLPGSDGHDHSLVRSTGERGVVLAWFPKAFTGG
jgi:peroxiredoxin Q/BCP